MGGGVGFGVGFVWALIKNFFGWGEARRESFNG